MDLWIHDDKKEELSADDDMCDCHHVVVLEIFLWHSSCLFLVRFYHGIVNHSGVGSIVNVIVNMLVLYPCVYLCQYVPRWRLPLCVVALRIRAASTFDTVQVVSLCVVLGMVTMMTWW